MPAGHHVGDAVSLHPVNAEVLDDRHADARHVVLSHDLGNGQRGIFARSGLHALNPRNEGSGRVIGANRDDGYHEQCHACEKPRAHRPPLEESIVSGR